MAGTADPRGLDLDFHLEFDSAAEVEELRRALLKARAAELSEVRRRDVRLTAGYGDATNREVMDDEARRAQMRFDALTRLLEALDRAEQAARADLPAEARQEPPAGRAGATGR